MLQHFYKNIYYDKYYVYIQFHDYQQVFYSQIPMRQLILISVFYHKEHLIFRYLYRFRFVYKYFMYVPMMSQKLRIKHILMQKLPEDIVYYIFSFFSFLEDETDTEFYRIKKLRE